MLVSSKIISKENINIPTACPTMKLSAPDGVYHLLNAVSLEYLYLSCNDICDW